MPLDKTALRRRALALGLTAALGVSIAPVGPATADVAPPPSAINVLSRFVSAMSSAAAESAARQAPRQAAAPLPAVTRDVNWNDVVASAESAVPQLTPREEIAARCPDLNDSKILRNGADADGLGLCVRSVHQARTDIAAAAIVEGFGLLGLPYSRSRRARDGYDDCSSFVGRSYRDAGKPLSDSDWEPSSSVMRYASWAHLVDQPLPGDILWRRGHVAMALADGYQMHASQSGDVTHVRAAGRYRKVLAVDTAA